MDWTALVSIDPGVTTGLAIAMLTAEGNIQPLVIKDSRDIEVIIQTIDVAIRTQGVEVVIVEDFIGGGFRNKDSKNTIEKLGFVKLYYGLVMEQKVKVQQPQFRKHAYEEAKAIIKASNFGPVHHAKDALAHLVAYCIKEKGYEKKHDVSRD